MRQSTTRLVAANVRAELARRSISGRALAEALGWTVSSTNRRLTGQTPLSVGDLAAIAQHLGVEPATLMDGATAGATT